MPINTSAERTLTGGRPETIENLRKRKEEIEASLNGSGKAVPRNEAERNKLHHKLNEELKQIEKKLIKMSEPPRPGQRL
jgi:hypothetical protein